MQYTLIATATHMLIETPKARLWNNANSIQGYKRYIHTHIYYEYNSYNSTIVKPRAIRTYLHTNNWQTDK